MISGDVWPRASSVSHLGAFWIAIMDTKQLSADLYALAATATDAASREYLQEVAYVLLSASVTGGVDQVGRQAEQQRLYNALTEATHATS